MRNNLLFDRCARIQNQLHQSSFLSQLDSTGFGWARLTLNNGHAVVNTSAANGPKAPTIISAISARVMGSLGRKAPSEAVTRWAATFGLGQVITRAEFASFICKVEGFGGNAAQAYTDNTDMGAKALALIPPTNLKSLAKVINPLRSFTSVKGQFTLFSWVPKS